MPSTLTEFKLLYFYILKVKQRTVYVKFHILQSCFTITLILQIRKVRPNMVQWPGLPGFLIPKSLLSPTSQCYLVINANRSF